MNGRRHILRVYKLALELYPKEFRDNYSEQMAIAARDVLDEADDSSRLIRLSLQLIIDLLWCCIKEHIERVKYVYTTATFKNKYTSAALLGVQICSVVVVLAFCLLTVEYITREFLLIKAAFDSPLFAYATLVTGLLPLAMIVLAFLMLLRSSRLSVWSNVVWACAVGVSGMIGFFTVSWLVRPLFMQFTDWRIEYFELTLVIATLLSLAYATSRLRLVARQR